MTSTCPRCRALIGPEEINVAKDVVRCRACNGAFALSDIVHGTIVPHGVDLANPPKGAWYRDDGLEVRIGARIRAVGAGLFFLLFSVFWNGGIWWFILMFVFGIAKPTLTSSGRPLSLSPPPAIFFVPFVVVGILTAIAAVFCFFGGVEVSIRGEEGRVLTGVGGFGWRRRFSPRAVTEVLIRAASWQQNDRAVHQIVLQGPEMRFGSGLSAPRREFMAAALRTRLLGS